MLAHLQDRVEQLARMTVLIDAGDLPGLVALQEQAVVLATDLQSSNAAELSELAKQISSLAEAIVMRSAADIDRTFGEIGRVIDRLQSAANAAEASTNSKDDSASDGEIITAWIAGCDAKLSELEERLLTLERSPNDQEVIEDIRRTMHTLKGECGVLSLNAAQELCHEAESLIDRCAEAKLALPIDPFLMLLDWFKAYVSKLSSQRDALPEPSDSVMNAIKNATGGASGAVRSQPSAGTPPAPSQNAAVASGPPDTTPVAFAPQSGTDENLSDFLCESKDHIAASEEALLALDQDRTNRELINTVFRAFHTIKGVSGFMALKPIVSLAHSAEQLLDGARSGTVTLGRAELDLILASCDMMTRLIGVLEGRLGPTHHELNSLVSKLDIAASGAGKYTSTPGSTIGSTAAPSNERAQTGATLPEPSRPAADSQNSESRAAGTQVVRKADQTVKVNTTRMDNLVTMVGELVIAQQMLVQDVVGTAGGGQRAQRTLSHMGKMIRDLQEVSMSLRMVNLKSTFQKMTRLVRDVSQKAGKQIEVITEGEDVELDRNVVEAITDPLVHMIRNSCDHGVEGTDERRAAGKSATGMVSLRAYHSGGSIVIEIGDDGRGLRREKLLAKAKSKGILAPDVDESSMPDSEVFALIFLPGFSTAEKVTDISGRGVGMDVVRRNIEALRGKIEIRSTPGQGTTFLLRLPLTMAIIDGMVVRVGGQRYVLPTLSIQQSFRPQEEQIKTAVGVGEMVCVRGSMLPIYRLNRILRCREGIDQISDALLIAMEADDSRFCLMVDEILGQHQVVIKTLTQTGQQLRGVSGGAILGDGRVALILDIAQIAALAREGSSSTRKAAEAGLLSAAA